MTVKITIDIIIINIEGEFIMKEILYQAIFLDEVSANKLIEKQEEKLPITIKNMHCTYKYMPSEKEINDFSKYILGKDFSLDVIGYCSDGKNSGFEVALKQEQDIAYTNSHIVNKGVERTTPHVTVSMSKDAKAKDTGLLDFKPIQNPFKIYGTGGFYVVDREKNIKGVTYEKIEEEIHNLPEIDLER